MTARAALCQHLLSGKILNIKNCFTLIGLTNAPREVSRMVEKPFGVIVSRMQMEGKSRYGQPVVWVDYRLNPTIPGNEEGIKLMRAYIEEQTTGIKLPPKETRAETPPPTTIEPKDYVQPELFS